MLSLGSNRDDGGQRIAQCLRALSEWLDIRDVTHTFVTPDIHAMAMHPPMMIPRMYANSVALVTLPSPPLVVASEQSLNHKLKATERSLGRSPQEKTMGIVSIDIDLVVTSGRILRPADFIRSYFFPCAAML
ncbi:MAG: 2-amino-4-hydroxy-6-hydroxymethyldihydropteridine diphosphokinase [Pseudoflavonifractor sp.]|nr:2-amino-4-hydroxy-6-hydroxymethyldihydropteridine diphosphokinase [Alloprevotella sp.]MCM1117236.1 2-amino-4-hydroxy-6-hydroxymethyldihydropteridine diphosphokinase [Pseudoflavonifractor sp.]